jgi:hypothetical protein
MRKLLGHHRPCVSAALFFFLVLCAADFSFDQSVLVHNVLFETCLLSGVEHADVIGTGFTSRPLLCWQPIYGYLTFRKPPVKQVDSDAD